MSASAAGRAIPASALPPDLATALVDILGDMLLADMQRYPNYAETLTRGGATGSSPSGHARSAPSPAKQMPLPLPPLRYPPAQYASAAA